MSNQPTLKILPDNQKGSFYTIECIKCCCKAARLPVRKTCYSEWSKDIAGVGGKLPLTPLLFKEKVYWFIFKFQQ